MTPTNNQVLLRVYTDEAAFCGDERVADLIVQRAHDRRLAGATVLRGRSGFGARSEIHSHHLFGISDNPPLVIEIVDDEERLRAFFAELRDLRNIGLVTLERVEVLARARPVREPEGDTE